MNELIFPLKPHKASCLLENGPSQSPSFLDVEKPSLSKNEELLIALCEELPLPQNDFLSGEEEEFFAKKEKRFAFKQILAVCTIVISIAIGMTTAMLFPKDLSFYGGILGVFLGIGGIFGGIWFGASSERKYFAVKNQRKEKSPLTSSSYESMALLLSDFIKNPSLHPKLKKAAAQLLVCALKQTKNGGFWNKVQNCVLALEKEYKIQKVQAMVNNLIPQNP